MTRVRKKWIRTDPISLVNASSADSVDELLQLMDVAATKEPHIYEEWVDIVDVSAPIPKPGPERSRLLVLLNEIRTKGGEERDESDLNFRVCEIDGWIEEAS